jgi:hypothetical protein
MALPVSVIGRRRRLDRDFQIDFQSALCALCIAYRVLRVLPRIVELTSMEGAGPKLLPASSRRVLRIFCADRCIHIQARERLARGRLLVARAITKYRRLLCRRWEGHE